MEGHTELEHKYEVDPDFAPPDLADVPGCAAVAEPRTSTLDASYYDTADLRLVARGVTLRRREGGDDAGWHLKLPVAEHVRREIRLPLDAGVRTVPSRLADLVAAYARGRPLDPVARLETRRIERAITGEDGRVLAVLADDTVRAQRLGRDGDPLRLMSWREMEIEAVDGPPELVTAVGERLRAHGARPAATGSKAARALADDLPPDGATASGQAAPRTAGDLLIAAVREQVRELLARDPLVRLADHDDDSVHAMRVAVRRVRSLLRTHRRLVDHGRGTALDWELRWLADALGRVRDLEVLAARLDRHLADLPGAVHRPAWVAELADEERTARDQLREELLSRRYFDLLDALDAFLAAPPLTERAGHPAGEETPAIVARAWRKMVRRQAEADRLPDGRTRDAALHAVRKAAKRARYTAEAAAPLGTAMAKSARRAKRVQQILGAHHDAVVAAERLAEAARRPDVSAEDAFVLGRLAEVEERAKREELRALPAAAKQIRKHKVLKARRPGLRTPPRHMPRTR